MTSTSAGVPPEDPPSLLNPSQDDAVDHLEPKVTEGLSVLSSLESILRKYSTDNGDGWLKQLERLKTKAEKPRVVIGIVGSTGAGKSSIINALLDEERLVPTNSMRACTAVVTEISYNHDDSSRYRAEVEFISKKDWEDELRLLFQDISDQQDFSTSSHDSNSDLAVAYAKLEAVYGIKKETAMEHSTDELMGRTNVSNLLGTKVTISENNVARFYRELQKYVDSPGRTRASRARKTPPPTSQLVDGKQSTEMPEHEIQLYPLVRVVRLYAKSAVLSTGASIVDLPGMQDANAARSNLAASYLAQCSGLWIVAPITRAVDDGAARTLLGDAFRRQIQLDGSLGAITFICSKTDDISLTEVNESLDIADSYQDDIDALDTRISSLKSELGQCEEQKNEVQKDHDAAVKRMMALEDIEEFQEERPANRKRKSAGDRLLDCGKASSNDSTESEMCICSDGNEGDDAPAGSKTAKEEVDNEMREARKLVKEAGSRKMTLDSQILETTQDLAKAEDEKSTLRRDFSLNCIITRNEYSKKHIKIDFADGIRELDQESAAVQNDDFDPSKPLRDYDAVAKSLTVFSVSTRAYQKLKGRYRRDVPVEGFDSLEQTEIPQLQKHCMQSTTIARRAAGVNFLNGLEQLLNSLRLCATGNLVESETTQEKVKEDASFLNEELEKLHRKLDIVVKETCSMLEKNFEERVFQNFNWAESTAVAASRDIVLDWNKPRSEGGISWNSYRAICRRNGVAKTIRGKHNWNEQLSHPMLAVIGPGWELLFQHAAPMLFEHFGELCNEHVDAFTSNIASRVQHRPGYSSLSLAIEDQLRTYRLSLRGVSAAATSLMNQNQRTASRMVSIPVEETLKSAYLLAAESKGKGVYNRMKDIISQGVENTSHHMFHRAATRVEVQLKEVIDLVRSVLDTRLRDILNVIGQDYHSIFKQSQNAADAEKNAEISAFLNGVTLFKENSNAQMTENEWIAANAHTASTAGPQETKVKEESPDCVSIKAEFP